MQKSFTSIATRVCLLVAFCSCFLFLYFLLNEEYLLSCNNLILLAGSFLLPLCIAGFFVISNCEQEKKESLSTIFWGILFFYYALLMIYMLFFASEFARDSFRVFDGNYLTSLSMQWKEHTNIIPFHTITLMLDAYELQYTHLATINILGNIVAFMPCALFFPKFFSVFKKFLPFVSFMALLIILVEVLQLLTLSGAMDIDDFILNLFGCVIAYGMMKIPLSQTILKKFFHYE